jgi:AcrR family transcriptional regulator
MPKILEGVRENLLREAQKQILENGYARTTIRSVATACGLGVGTVYNYFPSKDMLIASFVVEDWYRVMEQMKSTSAECPKMYLSCIYHALLDFAKNHQALFQDADAAKVFSSAFSQRHVQLRGQLADLMTPLCEGRENASFLAVFMAEAMLTWTMAKVPFDTLYSVLEKILYK